jgi:hypothetical protein
MGRRFFGGRFDVQARNGGALKAEADIELDRLRAENAALRGALEPVKKQVQNKHLFQANEEHCVTLNSWECRAILSAMKG